MGFVAAAGDWGRWKSLDRDAGEAFSIGQRHLNDARIVVVAQSKITGMGSSG